MTRGNILGNFLTYKLKTAKIIEDQNDLQITIMQVKLRV